VFSHDDKSVYAIVDTSGENEIWKFAADGSGKGEQLTGTATTTAGNCTHRRTAAGWVTPTRRAASGCWTWPPGPTR
jgi:hypothetical protein